MVAAIVMSDWGSPEVLVPAEIVVDAPAAGQILIDVRLAGVGPTDLAIRAGHLKGAFGSAPGSVLGFEAAGVVAAVGDGVSDVARGDAVVAFLPELGGYGEQVLARHWARRPDDVSEQLAAALPASAEAAVRVVEQTRVSQGDTVLIVGAAGSVGIVATQLAMARGVRVLAAVRPNEFDTVAALGALPVAYGPDLDAEVRAQGTPVDVVIDAAGSGVLATAVDLAGGPERVITLSDPHAADFGVTLSVPDASQISRRLAAAMDLLASGGLRLRSHVIRPLASAAAVHRELESGQLHAKALLAVRP